MIFFLTVFHQNVSRHHPRYNLGRKRSGFSQSRLLISGCREKICSAMCWELVRPSDPSGKPRSGSDCREKEQRKRNSVESCRAGEKSSVQTQLVAASTDALALKTVPFAPNECLRLTTLSCYLPSKKKKKTQISWDWRFWSQWRVDQPLPLCRSSPAPNNVQQSASVPAPDGKKTWMNPRWRCARCSKAQRQTRWTGSVAHRLRSLLLVSILGWAFSKCRQNE